AAQAAVDDAKAQIRDAEFDLQHCRITAPFTGRIGTHLVSVGNLIAGSRAAASPTTLLATLVPIDPIYLNFDMSESDFLIFSRNRARVKEATADKVEIALSDETQFARQGTLDFVDNVLNRSSGTIHARATVPNPNRLLTPGEFARVRLVVGAPMQALLIPDTAVLPDQSQHSVMTVALDGTVVPKQVEIGDLRGGLRVIRSGLTELAHQVLPKGIAFEWTELAFQQQQRGTPTLLVFGAVALFVFLVLVAQYESWKLPLATVLIVPMCLLASVTGLLARGMPIDILAQIGFVVLVGLAAKNAILIVEFARQKEEEGVACGEAAVHAARTRLRPILMTSLAFILGVAPLAVATGAGAEMRQSLGTAVLFGMLGVTCFGLVFTPA